MFGCLTKLSAKWAELVQKFVPRSRVRIFRNESTRSTPLDPKLTFWCVSYYFGCIRDRLVALRNSVQNRLNLCKSSCHEVASEFFATKPLDPLHWSPKLLFWCVLYRLCIFATIWLPYETRCTTGRTSAKVRATKSRRNYSQGTHPIHPIGA